MRKAARRVLLALAAISVCALVLIGALQAQPGLDTARDDLTVLQNWRRTGRIEDLADDPSHLPKPGYIIYLRLVMPTAGKNPAEGRRFLVSNTAWVLAGFAAALTTLLRRGRWAAASFFAVASLGNLPLRDSCDYVASEPLAVGIGLLFCALAAVSLTKPKVTVLIGASAPVILLVRPNLGWALLALGTLLYLSRRPRQWISVALLVGSFAIVTLALVAAGRLTGLPLSPVHINTSRAFLWGTADYYWPPDVGGWPVGQSVSETERLQMAKTKSRWIGFLRHWDADKARSLLWRLGHPVLSSDQLPSRWAPPGYTVLDKSIRSVWWLIGTLLLAASAVVAIGCRNEWRFAPALLALICLVQAILFGADSRLALPFVPLILFSLALALPVSRLSPALLIGVVLVLLLAFLILRIAPDAASSDYALVRGPGHFVAQTLSARHFPTKSDTATIHLRILRPDTFPLGVQIVANGRVVTRRDPANPASFPAFFSFSLSGPSLEEARRNGLRIEIESLGDERSAPAFLYYPVIPWPLDGFSTIDGLRALPSGYGGVTRGGLSVWVHPGKDSLVRSPVAEVRPAALCLQFGDGYPVASRD